MPSVLVLVLVSVSVSVLVSGLGLVLASFFFFFFFLPGLVWFVYGVAIAFLTRFADCVGTLISAGTTTFTTYMKEEVNQFVVSVNGCTAIFEKESDASILRTTSPGKLIKYAGMD
jgi:hypothetical protein